MPSNYILINRRCNTSERGGDIWIGDVYLLTRKDVNLKGWGTLGD